MKLFIVSMLILSGLSTLQAKEKRDFLELDGFTCTVSRFESAKTCFARLGSEIQEYEEENTVAVSSKKEILLDILKHDQYFNQQSEKLEVVKNAVYVAAILQHGDEHEWAYYAIGRGRDISPVYIASFNEADLYYEFEEENLPERFKNPRYWFFNEKDSDMVGGLDLEFDY